LEPLRHLRAHDAVIRGSFDHDQHPGRNANASSEFRIVAQGAFRSLALPWLDSMASWCPVLEGAPCIEFDVQYPRWHQDGAK
jgi:hypothetical protein